MAPTALLISTDTALAEELAAIIRTPWTLACHADGPSAPDLWSWIGVEIVVLDDDAIQDNDRGWILSKLGRHYREASLIYVAGDHNLLNERRARMNGAKYYAAKPLPGDLFALVIRSFMELHQRRSH